VGAIDYVGFVGNVAHHGIDVFSERPNAVGIVVAA
jgi:hypothetical protein